VYKTRFPAALKSVEEYFKEEEDWSEVRPRHSVYNPAGKEELQVNVMSISGISGG